MRTSVMLTLVLAAGVLFAAPGPGNNSSQVKFYTGAYGSSQFIWGHAALRSPLGAWEFHSNLPQATMDNAAAGNDDSTWVIAGYNSNSASYMFSHAVGRATWTTDNAPPLYVTNGGCAIIGDTLYYCSGYSYTSSACIDTLQKYSISTGTWTVASGPYSSGTTYNWQPLILACAGKLYYISGCNQPGTTSPTNNVWAYTPGAGWAQAASMNQGRVFGAGWVYHDTIWTAGGSVNDVGVATTEFYDPVADTWVIDDDVFPELATAVWGCASGVNSGSGWGTGWIAGGVNPGLALQDTIYYFNHATHTWSLTKGLYTRVYRGAGWGNPDGEAVVYGGSTGAFTPTIICQFEQQGPALDTDVALTAIVAPPSNMGQGSVYPIGTVRNAGADAQSNIPVTCWIDSAGRRVYSATDTVVGPLAAGATIDDTFATAWNSGPSGARYTVTMFTGLSGDMKPSNDTMDGTTTISGAIFADTIRVNRLDAAFWTPTIDGNIHPGEWAWSNEYDISDLAGRGGAPQTAGTALAYYLYDAAAGYLYCAVDLPKYTGRLDYDQFGIFMDENGDLAWATDSSEGNYWVEYVGGDSVIYRALLDTTPNVWLYGAVSGALSVSSTASGHLQFETRLPLGSQKYQLNAGVGDTVGYLQYAEVEGDGGPIVGWRPQTATLAQFANPRYYGTMIFEPVAAAQESREAKLVLHRVEPSIVRNQARISYYVAGKGSLSLGVYDVSGKLVRNLASGEATPGERAAIWDRTDNSGHLVASGTYFYRLTVDGHSASSKAVVLH
jgi:hypothetical protein